MPWYWILVILSAIFGPFEAMHALNKARKNREMRERQENQESARAESAGHSDDGQARSADDRQDCH